MLVFALVVLLLAVLFAVRTTLLTLTPGPEI